MDPSPANQQEQSHLLLTPLLISATGIIATALTLLLYQFIMTRICLRRWQLQQQQQQRFPVAERPEEEAMGGIDDKTLQDIPVLAYNVNNNQKGGYGLSFRRDQNECAVCLGELQEGEMVRLLPTCRHAFHLLCIDHWFLDHSTCPLCRSPAVSFGRGNVDLNFGSPSCPSSSSGASAPPEAAGMEDRRRSNGLRQHCTSLVSYSERSKPPLLPVQLKRSLSIGSGRTSLIPLQLGVQ